MIPGVIYCFLALLWAGTAFMLGYCLYDCHDIVGKAMSVLLALSVVVSVIEFFLLMGIGVAMIAGYH